LWIIFYKYFATNIKNLWQLAWRLLLPPPPSSIKIVTTICGVLYGAKLVNQAWLSLVALH